MKKREGVRLGVVGASGLVGQTLLQAITEMNLRFVEIRCFGYRSSGERILFQNDFLTIQPLCPNCFDGLDFVIFSAGKQVSLEYAAIAVDYNCIVIDNSSAFRLRPEIPLIVPEINFDEIKDAKLIANPNCATIQLVLVLNAIKKIASIRRVDVVSLQSVTGAGRSALEQFRLEVVGQDVMRRVLKHQIRDNLIPQIGDFDSSGYSEEENKIIFETKKILKMDNLQVSATCVRVPTIGGHSQAVRLEFDDEVDLLRIREALVSSPSVVFMDTNRTGEYPMPILTAGKNEVFVGRLRADKVSSKICHIWIVADNLRKGAAVNALQILLKLTEKFGLQILN
ncbi:MAG: aspartate-semialdehyde dehydrogenase [Deltaproteobacteria bacterium]|nr:aspartate-semialdehyde dehydrogenase [Deltaproteobacteria bacterium]